MLLLASIFRARREFLAAAPASPRSPEQRQPRGRTGSSAGLAGMQLSGREPAVLCRAVCPCTSPEQQGRAGKRPRRCDGRAAPPRAAVTGCIYFCCNRTLLGVPVGAEGPWGAVWSRCGVRGGSGARAGKHLMLLRRGCGLPWARVSQCSLKEKRSQEITHPRFQMSGLFFFL